MFESLPTSEVLSEMDDAALVAAMVDYARIEAMVGARRLAVIGEFTARRMAAAEHADWVVDDWAAASAEIGAALNISPGRAGGQMNLALTLRGSASECGGPVCLGGAGGPDGGDDRPPH